MKYVYLLESINCPGETYIGMTDDLRTRVSTHNSGQAKHTSKFKALEPRHLPWIFGP